MWSSAAVAHLLQGSTCFAFGDGILHTLVVTSGYLSYCCLSIISNQSAHFHTVCCNIQMVGSEFGIKNMKAWIHPALSQQFRLLVAV